VEYVPFTEETEDFERAVVEFDLWVWKTAGEEGGDCVKKVCHRHGRHSLNGDGQTRDLAPSAAGKEIRCNCLEYSQLTQTQ